jgi:hypothetical protein
MGRILNLGRSLLCPRDERVGASRRRRCHLITLIPRPSPPPSSFNIHSDLSSPLFLVQSFGRRSIFVPKRLLQVIASILVTKLCTASPPHLDSPPRCPKPGHLHHLPPLMLLRPAPHHPPPSEPVALPPRSLPLLNRPPLRHLRH